MNSLYNNHDRLFDIQLLLPSRIIKVLSGDTSFIGNINCHGTSATKKRQGRQVRLDLPSETHRNYNFSNAIAAESDTTPEIDNSPPDSTCPSPRALAHEEQSNGDSNTSDFECEDDDIFHSDSETDYSDRNEEPTLHRTITPGRSAHLFCYVISSSESKYLLISSSCKSQGHS